MMTLSSTAAGRAQWELASFGRFTWGKGRGGSERCETLMGGLTEVSNRVANGIWGKGLGMEIHGVVGCFLHIYLTGHYPTCPLSDVSVVNGTTCPIRRGQAKFGQG